MAVRTKGLVVFGSYSSTMFPSVCVEAVEKLGQSLQLTTSYGHATHCTVCTPL